MAKRGSDSFTPSGWNGSDPNVAKSRLFADSDPMGNVIAPLISSFRLRMLAPTTHRFPATTRKAVGIYRTTIVVTTRGAKASTSSTRETPTMPGAHQVRSWSATPLTYPVRTVVRRLSYMGRQFRSEGGDYPVDVTRFRERVPDALDKRDSDSHHAAAVAAQYEHDLNMSQIDRAGKGKSYQNIQDVCDDPDKTAPSRTQHVSTDDVLPRRGR